VIQNQSHIFTVLAQRTCDEEFEKTRETRHSFRLCFSLSKNIIASRVYLSGTIVHRTQTDDNNGINSTSHIDKLIPRVLFPSLPAGCFSRRAAVLKQRDVVGIYNGERQIPSNSF